MKQAEVNLLIANLWIIAGFTNGNWKGMVMIGIGFIWNLMYMWRLKE